MTLTRSITLVVCAAALVVSAGGWALWSPEGPMAVPLLLSAALGLLAMAVSSLWQWRDELRRVVAQAKSMSEGRLASVEPGTSGEFADLTRGMNAAVRRVTDLYAVQSAQVADLQRRALQDAVTGLSNRRQFLSRLDALLSDRLLPGCSLLIVRLPDLAALNSRHGNDAVDAWLESAGEAMLAYPRRVPQAFAGRLNGVDLALCLPVAGVAAETAESLRAALGAAAASTIGSLDIVVGGVDGLRRVGVGAALAAADAALARAEADREIVVRRQEDFIGDPAGARAWREQIASAIAEGRLRLAEEPVFGPAGEPLILDCPLQVQLDRGGEYHPADRWLALAARGGLLAQVDAAGLALALQAVARDGAARCVHVAAATLAATEARRQLGQTLGKDRAAAGSLVLEVEGASLARRSALWGEIGEWLHQHRLRLGLGHGGPSADGLDALAGMAVSHVRVDGSIVRGLPEDKAVADLAAGLVGLVHATGAKAYASGIDEPRALQALWSIGFDGASGPVVPGSWPVRKAR